MSEEQETKTPDERQNSSDEEDAASEEHKHGEQELPLEWTKLGTAKEAPRIRYPSDVVEIDKNDVELVIVGTAGQKITHMGSDLHTLLNPQLEQLVLRSHVIRTMEGLEGLERLDLLELYDNQITALQCLNEGENGAPGITLRVFDMSYNVIRDMAPVQFCPNLQELYLANNKLKGMAGLKGQKHLKKIDLGANRIRVMEPDELSGLENLEELWLGKNKIEHIQGLEKLTKLRRLDIQSNRLTAVENLTTQNETLEELYLAHNGIDDAGASQATGLAQSFPNLSMLDLSRNRLTTTDPFEHLKSLDELWLSGNEISSFERVQSLAALGESLDTVYLEYNPLQQDPLYRKKIAALVPSLQQIDANPIAGVGVAGGTVETNQEKMRRLQNIVLERAREETQKQKGAD